MDMKELALDDFTLSQAVFQIQFPESFHIWDKSGELWTTLQQKITGLASFQSSPNQVIFRVDQKSEFNVERDKAHITEHLPKRNLKGFFEQSKLFYDVVTSSMKIENLTRVGFRTIFKKEYESAQESSSFLLDMGLIYFPIEEKIYNIEGKINHATHRVQWQDEQFGVNVSFRTEVRGLDFNLPAGFGVVEDEKQAIDKLTKKHYELLIDVDYFTRKSLSKSQFEPSEWLHRVFHIIKRDTSTLLRSKRGLPSNT